MTGVSTLGQVLDQVERIKDQQILLNTLSTQISSGKKTQKFTGLGTDVLTSKKARADLSSLDSYINNITNADRRINLMLTSIEEFKAQAESFLAALVNFPQQDVHQEGDVVYYDDPLTTTVVENVPVGMNSAESDVELQSLQDLATNISDFMIELLNTQETDRYLLGGAETLVQPIDDNGTLEAALSTLMTQWKGGVITTDDLVADLQDRTATGGNPDAVTDTIVGYNAQLSAGNVRDIFVRVDDNTEVEYTILATEQAFRDVIVAVSYFKNENLPPIADVYLDGDPPFPAPPSTEGAPGADLDEMKDNFYQVFNALTAMVGEAVDDIDKLRFKLEGVRARISQIKDAHKNEQNILLDTIADVEDVDINEAAVKINALQLQLEASYSITARVQELSLVNFI